MKKTIKFVIFKTKWGHFGFAGTKSALCRTHLPGPDKKKVEFHLLKNYLNAQFDKTYFKLIQQQITEYFEGSCVNFSPDIPVSFDGLGIFSRKILTACRKIEFGQKTTYVGLAKKVGRPTASRAVGNALARNPLPLIIPCHRVIRTDGKMGGFTAPGGISLKRKMLTLEQKVVET